MKTLHLYIKTDCQFCKKAVNQLTLTNIPFVVTVVDKNPDFLEEQKKKWNWFTVPLIIQTINSEETLLGGSSELDEMLA